MRGTGAGMVVLAEGTNAKCRYYLMVLTWVWSYGMHCTDSGMAVQDRIPMQPDIANKKLELLAEMAPHTLLVGVSLCLCGCVGVGVCVSVSYRSRILTAMAYGTQVYGNGSTESMTAYHGLHRSVPHSSARTTPPVQTACRFVPALALRY